MTFVECLGLSQEDTMEGPLWRETLSRNLGSHDAAELAGGMCHGNGCRQETTRLHAISCTKMGWSSLNHNRVLHQALARSLRESKFQFVVQDARPFRERSSGQNGRLNSLRMYIRTEALLLNILIVNPPRFKNKAFRLDILIVNPCAGSNLGNTARHVGNNIVDEVERKKNKYRGSLTATYSLLPLAMSTCGEVGSDGHTFIKELVIRRIDHRSEVHSNEPQYLAEGTEVASLRRRFSFVLHQALSFRTRRHLCRQHVALESTRQLPLQGPVSVQAHRTEGVNGSEGREGANGVRGGIRVRGGKGGSNGVGGGNGEVNGHGDGDGAGAGAGGEVNEGAQDGSGDRSGDETGTGTGTGVETCRRTQDGKGDANGDGNEDSSGDGNGDEDNGNEDRIGDGGREANKRTKTKNSCRRLMGTGGDLGGKRKKCREVRVVPVAANPDNLESTKEAGERKQGTQGLSINCTGRESVSPLSHLIRGFRNNYH